ncbi:MAG: SH3 domain-containing protein [Bdellovibrionales bacterium]|nr:SH3 domain-containing protein [Bdellovibrionales bacterium]
MKAGSPAKMTGDHIVIRDTPSFKKGKILGVLKNGEKIEIVEISKEKAVVVDKEYRWVRIKSDSFTGWCTDEFLTADMNYQSEKLDLPAEITVNCEYIDPVTVTFNVKKGPTEIFEYCSNLTTLSFKFSKNIVVDSLSAVISWGDYGTKPEDDDGYYIIQDTIVKSKPILLGHKIKDYYNFNISELDPKLLVSQKKPMLKHSSKYVSIESNSEPTNPYAIEFIFLIDGKTFKFRSEVRTPKGC